MNPKATILVVDDEIKAQFLLRTLLEAEGYRVLTAGNGLEALAAARERPDVVLLDLMMPDMDGYDVCRRLRAEPELAAVPIIILTALDDRASRLRGLEAGADDFLSKPFDAPELRARLRTITRLNRYRRLFEERARFESAIAHAPHGVVLAEPDGRILHANQAFTDLLASGAVRPDNIFACFPAESAAQLRAAVAGPAPQPCEIELADGRQAHTVVEVTCSVIPWEGRGILQFHLRDLTEKKALEGQLIRSQRIELLGQLAGSVVHDMNNILTAIGGNAALLEFAEPGRTGQLVQNIQISVQRAGGMLRQLLAFARGSEGEFGLVDAGQTVAEVASLVRESFGRLFKVGCGTEPDLPAIRADPTQLHQIVMNLCVNARDAMPEGGQINLTGRHETVTEPLPAVGGATIVPGDYVVLRVRDAGTGMPPEVCARIFDPFFTTKPEGKGTGLGLATVLRLMQRHKGFVTFTTEVGRGTCFACHFPLAGPVNLETPGGSRAVA